MPSTHRTANAPWGGLWILLLAGFVTIFDLFVVNIAIPSLQQDLGASLTQSGYIIAGYELAFGLLLITAGRLGDLFGRRRVFSLGMLGFTLASLLCALSQSAEQLIAARLLQGLAAALLLPQVYASIRVNFHGHDSRKAFGLLGMVLGFAAIAGQMLGGWLLHADLWELGWRNLFLINLPIGLAALLLRRLIPESYATQDNGFDWPGVALSSLALGLLLVPLLEGPAQGWPAWSWLSLLASLVMFALFRWHEQRARYPLLDFGLLKLPGFACGGALVLLIYSTSSSLFLGFALLTQVGLGLDPFIAGSIFAPCSVAFIAASLLAPRLLARLGIRSMFWGALFYSASLLVLMLQVSYGGNRLDALQLIPALVLLGFTQGLIMTPLINLVLGFVVAERAGMAAGVLSTLQQVGAAFGVALFTWLFGQDNPVASYPHAFVLGMLYNLAASLLACLLLRRLVGSSAQASQQAQPEQRTREK